MSQEAIFVVGILVFAVTVWGTVMAGGYWMGEIADAEDEHLEPEAGSDAPPLSSP